VAVDDRGGRSASGQDQPHDLHGFGEPQAVLLIETEAARGVAVQILGEVASGFLDPAQIDGGGFEVFASRLAQTPYQGGCLV